MNAMLQAMYNGYLIKFPFETKISHKLRDRYDLKAHVLRGKFAHPFACVPLDSTYETIYMFETEEALNAFNALIRERI